MSAATKENIRKLLSITGVTHQQLADIAGVDRSAVSHWKSGKAEPRMGHLQKIADHYGITTANLANPHGMDYVHKGLDGRLHDDNSARIDALKSSVMELGSNSSAIDVLRLAMSVSQTKPSATMLTKDESYLLDMFRSLNVEGRGLVLSTVAAFVRSGSYAG